MTNMPSLFPDRSSILQQTPLAPLDYLDMYSTNTQCAPQLAAFRPLPSLCSLYDSAHSEPHDLRCRWASLPSAPRPMYSQGSDGTLPPSYTAAHRNSSGTSGKSGPPVLPPISIPEQIRLDECQQMSTSSRAPAANQKKEEKPIGGVAAHLDYEMEDMVDFVSQTAQGMYDIYASGLCLADIDMARSVLDSRGSVHQDFRKFVSQVLSSTRLPSSTIILGLHYLAQRMTMLSSRGEFDHGSGQIYQMLTVGLLLGSKFLDDNTFQNRSWSEVSSIAVKELNDAEIDWLVQSGWNMHIDPQDPDTFSLWHRQWITFKANRANAKVDRSLAQSLRQTHLHGDNLRRQVSVIQQSSPSKRIWSQQPDIRLGNLRNPPPPPHWNTPPYDNWQSSHFGNDCSPPSAPETGPTTPEWYDARNNFEYSNRHQSYPTLKVPPPLQVVGSTVSSEYPTPYAQQFNPSFNLQHSHTHACRCHQCAPYFDRYGMATGYLPQSVIG